MTFRLLLVFALLACMSSVGQDDSSSLADAARKSRALAAKAKTVINEDNFNANHGPIPDMNIDGVDNSDEIIKAINAYKKDHTPEEIELAVREWYDRYDMMFQKAFDENDAIKSRKQDRQVNAPRYFYPDGDYSATYRQMDEARRQALLADLQDQKKVQKNGLLEARIQQTLQKVRTAIGSNGLHYDWMKIRFGNGNGSW